MLMLRAPSLRAYHWQGLPAAETARLVGLLNPAVFPEPLDPAMVRGRATTLAFYPGCRFVELVDTGRPDPNRRLALVGPREAVLLNKRNEPIYRCNERLPIRLGADNAAAYAMFFFDHVHGRHRRFLILEEAADIDWEPGADRRVAALLSHKVHGPFHIGLDDRGRHVLDCMMIFRNALFRCKARVEPSGAIELTDEVLLMEDLPVREDLPLARQPMLIESGGQLYGRASR